MAALPKNILVVDDSLTIRKFVERTLARQPFVNRLVMAEAALPGLEMINSLRPDLVITDYTLPDLCGDKLCERLLENAELRSIPVILMSSDGQEIAAFQQRLGNVARVIVKPFSKELLIATVAYVIDKCGAPLAKGASKVSIAFRGSTSSYSLVNALREIAQRRLTGTLVLAAARTVAHAFCRDGKMRLVSTKDVDLYLDGTPYFTRGRKSRIWQACEDRQRETLCPFLLNLADEGGLAELTAATLTDLYSRRLFARLWQEREVKFEFEESALLPFVDRVRPTAVSMDAWILQALRCVKSCGEVELFLEDPMGVPFLTPMGYAHIGQVFPDMEERRILSLVNGGTRLADICDRLGMPPETAAHRLFCYRQLGFIDYWPSSLFEASNGTD